MKKAVLLTLLLCSCAGLMTPPETIRNPDCLSSHALKFFQVDDKISLVQLYYCYPAEGDTRFERSCGSRIALQANGDVFAVDMNQFTKDVYDGYKVILGSYCMVENGTHTYYNTMGAKKTIRKLKIIESQIPNPEYKKWQEEQVVKDNEKTDDNKQTDK